VSIDTRAVAERIRREHGSQLPPAPVRESHRDRELRQEQTKYALETQILPLVNEQRVRDRQPALSESQEDEIVSTILSSMFLLPNLFAILASEPLAEDIAIFVGQEVRVDRADGTIGFYPAVAHTDEELLSVIGDIATAHHRPFNFEHPFVDVQLSPRLRLHAQGFDVVSRPAIFIRVHRMMGATFDELFEWGSISAGMRYLLGTVVPEAELSVATSGVQGSGKTTITRSIALAYPPLTRIVTVETDFELGLVSLGQQWTQEMQARLAMTSQGGGISVADMMAPVLRTRAAVNIVGEVRSTEADAAVRAANIGQGTLVTVHGHSAIAGLEQLIDRICERGTQRDLAARMVYQAFDLVVQCGMSRNRQRWIQEIVAPGVEGDRCVVHTLYGAQSGYRDLRGRASATAWPDLLLAKIHTNYPGFDLDAALDDTYRPPAEAAAAASSRRADDELVLG
jgi:Flp pilus assembly CpaF family ATPase